VTWDESEARTLLAHYGINISRWANDPSGASKVQLLIAIDRMKKLAEQLADDKPKEGEKQ
jgi:hypothetical protein